MMQISDDQFQQLIDAALGTLPPEHVANLRNVAILYEDEPTPEQRVTLELRNDQTLLGLYQGVPLSQRQGMTAGLPDRITLFKGPLSASAQTLPELQEAIRHTLWHEIAHYYGLDHPAIADLER